ncbi:GNAT family N-acetyltransferase, partial [Candidatus Binatus sp.]
MKIELLTASTVDLDELGRLQRESFLGVADPDQLAGVQTPEYYRWKYTQAGGEARIAQIRNDNGELVAMNSAFPVTLTNGDKTTRGWQSCDTATHPSARGRGYFLKCLNALKETFDEGEVFFGYPNANSAHGFTKFGWQRISTLQIFAGIIPPFSALPKIRRIDRFGPEQDDLAARLAAPGRIMIQRSAAYMNDRYCSPQRPLYT